MKSREKQKTSDKQGMTRQEENTREKNQITKGFKKETFSSSKNRPQKILNLFGPKSRDGDEEKRVKKQKKKTKRSRSKGREEEC